MCFGVNYIYQDKQIMHYFPQPYAKLPVKKRDGSIVLLPWGRRQHQPGNLPLGGWAWLDSIETGKWEKFFPQPVKLYSSRLGFRNFVPGLLLACEVLSRNYRRCSRPTLR